MKLIYRLVVITSLFFLSGLIFDIEVGISSSATSEDTRSQPVAEYLEVLRIADTFLWAWVSGDSEGGVNLISNRLRTKIKDESWFEQFLVGQSNPHHQGFEIGNGKKIQLDRYAFPVILYELYTGEKTGLGYPGTLEIVKEGRDWRVDVLPKSLDNR